MDQTIAHYNILERLGGGALGDVYRARDTKVGRTVALMVPPDELLAGTPQREAFQRDARAAATLNHPNIAMLFDVVEQKGHLYLAYEFAAGPSLRQEMGGKPVPIRRTIELAAQIADALAEGHATGFVHGDLRPENVVVTPKGSTKILNFGMAKWTSGGAARVRAATSPDTLTPEDSEVVGYLSPEQALGSAIDARSDLFSLAAIIYELVTGVNPFAGTNAAETILNVIRATPRPTSAVMPNVPRELDTIVSRALAKDLSARYQSAAALAADLRSVSALLDVREGDARPTSVIPLEEERSHAIWWIALLVVAVGLAVWWFGVGR